MYMVNRGPRHPLRNLNRRTQRINDIAPIQQSNNSPDQSNNGDNSRNSSSSSSISEMSSPKPVFNSKKNFNRSNSNNTPPAAVASAPAAAAAAMTQEAAPRPMTPQHEEAARYLADAWHRTQQEYETSMRQGRERGPVVYQEKSNTLQDFEPIDLEQWHAQRTLQKYQQ